MLATFIATPASADVIWDGNGSLVDKGYEEWGMPFSWDTESGVAHAGTAYQNFTTHIGGNYSLAAAAAAAALNNANGWKVEWGVQVLQNTLIYTPGDFFGVFFLVEEQVGGVCALLRTDRVNWYSAGMETWSPMPPNLGAVITTMVDMTSGYHKLGITVAPNATVAHVWVDDVDQGSVTLTIGGFGRPAVAFGDGSNGSHGEANWDYVNVIPEPSAMSLLATGLLGLLCYAWRRRRS